MTGYVAGDGGVTGISAHSSPTRQSNFAWTHASRYTIIQGRHARTRQIWTTTVVGVWFWPVVFFGGGGGRKYLVHFTEIRKENTKWMNLVLERVESPGSQAHSSRSGVAWSHAVGVWF